MVHAGHFPPVFTRCVHFGANVGLVGRVVAVKTALDKDSFHPGGTTVRELYFGFKENIFQVFERITLVASFVGS